MHQLNLHNDYESWLYAEHKDIWVFDKLIVARKAGHLCGPRGMKVPKPGIYMVRPVINFHGMGVGARTMYLEDKTDHLNPGEFWCEYFDGEHVSVDYRGTNPIISVVGTKDSNNPHQRFIHWKKVDHFVPLPQMLVWMCLRYKTINCEFIGGKLIEVHLRGNPDFSYGNTEMIPVWKGNTTTPPSGFRFIADDDSTNDERIGIFVN
jgi:hypothetical protein